MTQPLPATRSQQTGAAAGGHPGPARVYDSQTERPATSRPALHSEFSSSWHRLGAASASASSDPSRGRWGDAGGPRRAAVAKSASLPWRRLALTGRRRVRKEGPAGGPRPRLHGDQGQAGVAAWSHASRRPDGISSVPCTRQGPSLPAHELRRPRRVTGKVRRLRSRSTGENRHQPACLPEASGSLGAVTQSSGRLGTRHARLLLANHMRVSDAPVYDHRTVRTRRALTRRVPSRRHAPSREQGPAL